MMKDLWYFIVDPTPIMLTGVNFFMCALVSYGCLCRIRLTSKDTKVFARLVYVSIFGLMLASAFRGPLLGNQITQWWPILFTLGLWMLLLVNMGAWQGGSPPPGMQKSGRTRPIPLDVWPEFMTTQPTYPTPAPLRPWPIQAAKDLVDLFCKP